MNNRFTRGALAASSLVLAMQFGLVSPASAYVLSADNDVIGQDLTAQFLTDAPNGTLVAIYTNDTRYAFGPLNPPLNIVWNTFNPCENLDVTVRVYDEAYSGQPDDYDNLTWESPYDAEYTIGLIVVGPSAGACTSYDPYAAETITLEADRTSVSRDNPLVTLTSNGEDDALVVVFVNGVWETFYLLNQLNGQTTGWEAFAPCITVDMEYRLYNSFVPGNPVPPYSDPYDAGVLIEFVGDDTDDCNPKWGTQDAGGSDDSTEPLAQTGSDASAVTGLTGVAGVAAIAVAAAIARRARRAQR